jgi:DNA-binding NarL/FixJ family response regulator
MKARPKVRGRQVRRNGLSFRTVTENAIVVISRNGALHRSAGLPGREQFETTVLVAMQSAHVREALVAMLGATEGFRIVAETDNHESAVEAARKQRPDLALVEPELSNCRGWWAIQQIQAEQSAGVIVALGQRANAQFARLVGAQTYVQIGTAPRDLLRALEAAVAVRTKPASSAQTEQHLLADAYPVLQKPAFVDL